MRRRLSSALSIAIATVTLAFACKKAPPPPPPPESAGPSDGGAHSFGHADGGDRVDEWIALSKTDASPWHFEPDASVPDLDTDYLESPAKFGASIGHTSVVFKLTLANGKKAAYKPASRRGPARYKGEIAAYRLSRALGIDTVPRAFFRAMGRSDLAMVLPGDAGELFKREAIVDRDVVRGAIIPWIPHLEFLALEAEPWWSRWRGWMKRGADIPPDMQSIARDASVLVVFDFLTGNWDRWSGANIGLDRAGGRLRFIDNDGAFFEKPPAAALDKTRKLLRGIDRFSRGLVTKLRAMDADALAAAIGTETPGVPLLSDAALAGVEARRVEALGVIDGKLKQAGETDTLFFE